jgi:hypothetical protein
MASTYEPIATTTLGSTTDTVTFSSIPATYTDLVLIAAARDSSTSYYNAQFGLRFNGDTAANYSTTEVTGDGTSATSGRTSNQTWAILGKVPNQTSGYSSSTFGATVFQIMNYANTTTYKTVLSRSNYLFGSTDGYVTAKVGLWRKTPETINSVSVYTNSGYGFVSGSTFTLYGIKAF